VPTMKISVSRGSSVETQADALILPIYEDEKELRGAAGILDEATSGAVGAVLKAGDFRGKRGKTAVLYPDVGLRSRRLILTGLGKRGEQEAEAVRGAFAAAAREARNLRLSTVAWEAEEGFFDAPLAEAAGAAVEGVRLGLYTFDRFKTQNKEERHDLEGFTITTGAKNPPKELVSAVERADVICDAVVFARDLVSTPANHLTPRDLAAAAVGLAKGRKGLGVQVMDEKEMAKRGMNALLGVAKGSAQPPRFIILKYTGGKRKDPPVVLVGKGLTFDSGGISLKPAEKMDEMKSDMAGAAAVMGTLRAAADLSLPLNIVGLCPTTENLPGGNALKPGDVLTSLAGKTIEVVNTDAEGRLILADALAYAQTLKPAAVVDIATLTGACIVALGDIAIGMMGTDEGLKGKMRAASERTGERVWELPLWREYEELIKSDVADVKNSAGRYGGAITAAAFLKQFVGDYPWVHLDIAGPAWLTKDRPYIPKGASGIGVRLLVEFLALFSP